MPKLVQYFKQNNCNSDKELSAVRNLVKCSELYSAELRMREQPHSNARVAAWNQLEDKQNANRRQLIRRKPRLIEPRKNRSEILTHRQPLKQIKNSLTSRPEKKYVKITEVPKSVFVENVELVLEKPIKLNQRCSTIELIKRKIKNQRIKQRNQTRLLLINNPLRASHIFEQRSRTLPAEIGTNKAQLIEKRVKSNRFTRILYERYDSRLSKIYQLTTADL